MKNFLHQFLENLASGKAEFLIPRRKGLRKMIDGHVFHDHAEIFFQVSGATVFTFPLQRITLTKDQVLIVPPELPHAERVEKEKGFFETIVITAASDSFQCHISGESKSGIPIINYYETVKSEENIRIRQLTDLLIGGGLRNDFYGTTINRSLLQALVASAAGLLSDSLDHSRENNKIREVKNTVLSHYHQRELSVAQLADQVNCSADYLSWLFHRETGVTLNKYINRLRLSRATDLLKNTDYTISEIAWICGFKTPAYFSRVFSGSFSLSPRDYRENN